jgi:tRNA-uridine 2-sulfurtransferase
MKMPVNLRGKRVFVGLSGGVDSAVTALLLKECGAEVCGVFIKGAYPEGMPCTWAAERRDAMRVAARLKIPFDTLDASKEYAASVLDYLLSEYAAGRTPNPDIMCNRDVKFGAFLDFAVKNGADYIATGHYARIEDGRLLRGFDSTKDQSYFLWNVRKEALAKTLFPLGGMRKEEVRQLALVRGLPVAQKHDSQGICFLGPVSVEDFLRARIPVAPGKAVDEAGKEIGTHPGAVLSTLGERVALADAASGPWYVLAKDLEKNLLTVAREPKRKEAVTGIALADMNLLADASGEIAAEYRYRGPLIEGRLEGNEFIPSSTLDEPIASGQSLVLYRGAECLGGGIIARA